MTWFLGVTSGVTLAVALTLLARTVALRGNLHDIRHLQKAQYERLLEDVTTGFTALRLDMGLPAVTGYCGICLQWTAGDVSRHLDYCRFSRATAVRDWKRAHPGEPLPEEAEGPGEQQQQGH